MYLRRVSRPAVPRLASLGQDEWAWDSWDFFDPALIEATDPSAFEIPAIDTMDFELWDWDAGAFFDSAFAVEDVLPIDAAMFAAVEPTWWDTATSWFPSAETWGQIGRAAGTVVQAATPLALPLLQQAIIGTPTPTPTAPRAPAPAGYTYAPTGQLVRQPAPAGYAYSPTGQLVSPTGQVMTYAPTGQLVPAPAGSPWTMPLLLLGAAAVLGGALYLTAGRRRRAA